MFDLNKDLKSVVPGRAIPQTVVLEELYNISQDGVPASLPVRVTGPRRVTRKWVTVDHAHLAHMKPMRYPDIVAQILSYAHLAHIYPMWNPPGLPTSNPYPVHAQLAHMEPMYNPDNCPPPNHAHFIPMSHRLRPYGIQVDMLAGSGFTFL